jgi:hypothetical protein
MAGIDGYLERKQDLKWSTVFVLTPEEFQKVIESDKFTGIQILNIIPYPNGKPGFYFIHMRYIDNVDSIFSAEAALRKILATESATLPDGETISVSHSQFDMGTIADMFDGNNETVTRTFEANPMQIQVGFPEPRELKGVTVRVGGVESRVTVTVYPGDKPTPITFQVDKAQTADPRDVIIDFGGTIQSARMDIEVLSVNDSEPAHVHVWEVTFW